MSDPQYHQPANAMISSTTYETSLQALNGLVELQHLISTRHVTSPPEGERRRGCGDTTSPTVESTPTRGRPSGRASVLSVATLPSSGGVEELHQQSGAEPSDLDLP
ncbi:unnamed protein product [Merluccius merluccius]